MWSSDSTAMICSIQKRKKTKRLSKNVNPERIVALKTNLASQNQLTLLYDEQSFSVTNVRTQDVNFNDRQC